MKVSAVLSPHDACNKLNGGNMEVMNEAMLGGKVGAHLVSTPSGKVGAFGEYS